MLLTCRDIAVSSWFAYFSTVSVGVEEVMVIFVEVVWIVVGIAVGVAIVLIVIVIVKW